MNACIVPGCKNDGEHQMKLYVRRAGSNTGAVIAPTLKGRICSDHLSGGFEMDIVLRPKRTGRADISTRGEKGSTVGVPERKTVPIPAFT